MTATHALLADPPLYAAAVAALGHDPLRRATAVRTNPTTVTALATGARR